MKRRIYALAASTAFVGVGALAAQTPSPISSADFAVAGLTADTDSVAIRGALGVPDSIVAHDNPLDPGGRLPTWYYEDLIVSFGYAPAPVGFMITGPAFATYRGLRVGDSPEDARRLYGEPEFAREDLLMFSDPADLEGLHVIRADLINGVIRRIYVGWLLD